MTAKEFLQMGYHLDKRIEIQREKVEAMRTMAERTTRNIDGMPGGKGRHDGREELIVKMADAERAIIDNVDALLTIQAEINTAIEGVSDPQLQMLLQYRYMLYKRWPEIADKMGYDIRHVLRLHAKALDLVKVPSKYAQQETA